MTHDPSALSGVLGILAVFTVVFLLGWLNEASCKRAVAAERRRVAAMLRRMLDEDVAA